MKILVACLLLFLTACDPEYTKVSCSDECAQIPDYHVPESPLHTRWVKVLNKNPIDGFSLGDWCVAYIEHLHKLHTSVYLVHDLAEFSGTMCPNKTVVYWEGER